MNNINVQIIISGILPMVVCLIVIPVIIQLSLRFKLIDKPNARKLHKNPISRLGGVGIFISALAGVLLSNQGLEAMSTWPVLFTSVGLLFLTGIWDDLKDISARLRFIIQIFCAAALAISGIRITSLEGAFGIQELPVYAQYVITILIIVGTTNAFNLIDGIDGLAGGLAFISVVVLAVLTYYLKLYPLVILLTAFAGALLGFLKHNSSPARIFMGDGGSLVLGYLMSSVGILVIEQAKIHPDIIHPSKAAMLITAILVIPVIDTVRVFSSRMMKSKSPFAADKTHIHHLFLVAGLNHRKTALILYSLQIFLIMLAIFLPNAAGMSLTIIAMVILFHLIIGILRVNKAVVQWLQIIKRMERGEIV